MYLVDVVKCHQFYLVNSKQDIQNTALNQIGELVEFQEFTESEMLLTLSVASKSRFVGIVLECGSYLIDGIAHALFTNIVMTRLIPVPKPG